MDGPTIGFGYRVGGHYFLSQTIEDFSQNPLRFDGKRNKFHIPKNQGSKRN
jgi:hypothetical protein